MSTTTIARLYLDDVRRRFQDAKAQADRALAQVPAERWSVRLDPGSNSLVTLVLHISGNQISRFTDFLTSDGEKPWRDRDTEFEDTEIAPDALRARWERGWATLFAALDALGDDDLARTVLIRAEPHTVVEAVNRQLAHYALHVGQMLFLAKHLAGPSWMSQSVPRGGSAAFNAEKFEKR